MRKRKKLLLGRGVEALGGTKIVVKSLAKTFLTSRKLLKPGRKAPPSEIILIFREIIF